MRFATPEAFLLLPLVPFVLWWSLRPQRQMAARYSQLALLRKLPEGWAVWGPRMLAALRGAALLLLITALARPQKIDGQDRSHSDGITIQLVIDNSYSMREEDYDLDSRSISRLDAVKHALRLFVNGGEQGLEGRPHDRIGLISFARDPDVLCPATLDHSAVMQAIDDLQLAPPVGTNIGDGLGWALERLRNDPSKEKVVILLSDGAHTIKDSVLQPLEAAQLAADLKIKVYTIGAVGNRGGNAGLSSWQQLLLSNRHKRAEVGERCLQRIAEATGGEYYRATDTEGLTSIYKEIDRLETTRLERNVEVNYEERYLIVALPGVVLAVLEQLLAATRFLRIP